MTFPEFQRQVEWWQSYFAKMSLKAYIIGVLYYPGLPDVYKIVCTLIPQHFNVILSAKPVWPNMTTIPYMLRVSLNQDLIDEKIDLKRA